MRHTLKIIKIIGKSAYKLELPDSWKKAGIHPAFNETLLVLCHPPVFPLQQVPPPPDVINDHVEYEVKKTFMSGCIEVKYSSW